MKRRLLAGLLTLIMALSLLPCSALAAGPMRAIKDSPDTVDTYVFMNGSTELSRQTVKAGDTLVQPETPSQGGISPAGKMRRIRNRPSVPWRP